MPVISQDGTILDSEDLSLRIEVAVRSAVLNNAISKSLDEKLIVDQVSSIDFIGEGVERL